MLGKTGLKKLVTKEKKEEEGKGILMRYDNEWEKKSQPLRLIELIKWKGKGCSSFSSESSIFFSASTSNTINIYNCWLSNKQQFFLPPFAYRSEEDPWHPIKHNYKRVESIQPVRTYLAFKYMQNKALVDSLATFTQRSHHTFSQFIPTMGMNIVANANLCWQLLC